MSGTGDTNDLYDDEDGTLPFMVETRLRHDKVVVELPRYQHDPICPKCLGDKVKMTYHQEALSSRYSHCLELYGVVPQQSQEHICFECNRCHYGWFTAIATEEALLLAEAMPRQPQVDEYDE
jgi:hypothetical protein